MVECYYCVVVYGVFDVNDLCLCGVCGVNFEFGNIMRIII